MKGIPEYVRGSDSLSHFARTGYTGPPDLRSGAGQSSRRRAQLRERISGKELNLFLFQQALLELFRFYVNEFHPGCPVKYAVGDTFGCGKAQMGKNSVLDAFNVLDVQSRVDIDACFQKFLDILAAFSVAGSIYVGVGQVLDQDQLRPSFDAGVQI